MSCKSTTGGYEELFSTWARFAKVSMLFTSRFRALAYIQLANAISSAYLLLSGSQALLLWTMQRCWTFTMLGVAVGLMPVSTEDSLSSCCMHLKSEPILSGAPHMTFNLGNEPEGCSLRSASWQNKGWNRTAVNCYGEKYCVQSPHRMKASMPKHVTLITYIGPVANALYISPGCLYSGYTPAGAHWLKIKSFTSEEVHAPPQHTKRQAKLAWCC